MSRKEADDSRPTRSEAQPSDGRQPERERVASAKARLRVDLELCQGHGVCVGEAPEVFRVAERDGDYAQVQILLAEPPEALRAQVEAAVRYCPNRALSLVDEL